MKTARSRFQSEKGSALMVVMMVMIIMGLLTASMLSFSASEQRANEFHRLVLQTRNTAENTVNFAVAQLSTKLYRLRSTATMQYSKGDNQIYLPPSDKILTNRFGVATVELHAGLTDSTELTYIDPREAKYATNPNQNLCVITSTVPIVASATISSPRIGHYTSYLQQVQSVAQIPLYQFAIYYNGDLEFGPGLDMIIAGPVHANGDLAVRCQDGKSNTVQFKDRVTATGGFFANQTKIGAIYNDTGSENTSAGGDGKLYFQDPSGAVIGIYKDSVWRDHAMSKDAKGPVTEETVAAFKEFASIYKGNLRTSAHDQKPISLPGTAPDPSNKTRRNIARSVIEAPDTSDTSTMIQDKFSRRAGLYIIVNPTAEIRTGTLPNANPVTISPYSYRCWLNSIAKDGITHTLTEVVLPGQPSYWDAGTSAMVVNNLPNRYTNCTAIGSNQVIRIPLPPGMIKDGVKKFTTATSQAGCNLGLDSTKGDGTGTMADLASPNTAGYTTGNPSITSISATFTDGYFYDLRRANGNNGYGALATSRKDVPFVPRAITKIDFDMTRFKLMIERTLNSAETSSSIYNPDVPNAVNWANNILNPSASTSSYPLAIRTGIDGAYKYTVFPKDASGTIVSDPFKMYTAPTATVPTATPVAGTDLYNNALYATPWYDGIAVYIHSVDAKKREQHATEANKHARMDSGVRFINGRGPIPTLVADNRTGCSIATDDAAYIVGHLNADGSINSTEDDTKNPGGYSSRYPETSSERLCNIMADALTVLSQPRFAKDGTSTNYKQTSGWCDSLSANAISSASTKWQTTDPGTGNTKDGIITKMYVSNMPFLGSFSDSASATKAAKYINSSGKMADYGYTSSVDSTYKFSGGDTEISSCLLQGIVRTTSSTKPRQMELGTTTLLAYQTMGYQNSGGVHNFPRMSENWNGDLYIRGSMVAMFESEVACEPWLATRVYSAPGRKWGLHNNLRAENSSEGKHDVPLEPIMIHVSRLHFTDLKSTEYATEKAKITALKDE